MLVFNLQKDAEYLSSPSKSPMTIKKPKSNLVVKDHERDALISEVSDILGCL